MGLPPREVRDIVNNALEPEISHTLSLYPYPTAPELRFGCGGRSKDRKEGTAMLICNGLATGISIGFAKPEWMNFHFALTPKDSPNRTPSYSNHRLRKLLPFVYLMHFTKRKMGKVVSGYEVWEDHGCILKPSGYPLSTWRVPFYSRGVVDPCHRWTSIFIGKIKG